MRHEVLNIDPEQYNCINNLITIFALKVVLLLKMQMQIIYVCNIEMTYVKNLTGSRRILVCKDYKVIFVRSPQYALEDWHTRQ